MRRLVIMIAAAVLLVSGCTSDADSGGDPAGDSASTPSGGSSSTAAPAPTGPDCAEVWVAGATLPEDYDTCVDDGVAGSQDVVPCVDGQRLIAFRDEFFAVTGSEITQPDVAPMQDTEEFGSAFSTCTGE